MLLTLEERNKGNESNRRDRRTQQQVSNRNNNNKQHTIACEVFCAAWLPIYSFNRVLSLVCTFFFFFLFFFSFFFNSSLLICCRHVHASVFSLSLLRARFSICRFVFHPRCSQAPHQVDTRGWSANNQQKEATTVQEETTVNAQINDQVADRPEWKWRKAVQRQSEGEEDAERQRITTEHE